MDKETERQLLHLLVGLFTISLLYYFGKGITLAIVFFVILIGTLFINASMTGRRLSFVEWFVRRFERENQLFPGWGSACYATGALIPLVFLNDVDAIAAIIFMLAAGDGASTIAGIRWGRSRLFYNNKKTVEGMAAFLSVSMLGYLFVGSGIIPLAIIAAIAESIDSGVDDNLVIPIACTAFLLAI